MSFPSSAMRPDRSYTTTDLTFEHVLDFRRYDFELGLRRPNPKDVEFRLIEIKDSETVAAFLSEGRVRSRPRGVIREEDVRHFRLAFNHHGTYDIVCTTISYAIRPDGPLPG